MNMPNALAYFAALLPLSWSNDMTAMAIALLVAGMVLVIGELLLPTHGLLGLLGLICFGVVIGICFSINRWLGLGVFAAAVLASPVLAQVGLRLWQRSPIGRRIVLPPADVAPAPAPVQIGVTGIAVTELRPLGECEFGNVRLEASSELGIIRAGARVRVVAVDNGRPTVRRVETPATV
jgi:membrane-bound ClpP family serine protease